MIELTCTESTCLQPAIGIVSVCSRAICALPLPIAWGSTLQQAMEQRERERDLEWMCREHDANRSIRDLER